MNILSKLLQFRGIKDTSELDAEERQQFQEWQEILDKDEIAASDIAEFCDRAMQTIELQFEDIDLPSEKMGRLTLQHAIYRKLKELITAPSAQRESLVEYLTNLMR